MRKNALVVLTDHRQERIQRYAYLHSSGNHRLHGPLAEGRYQLLVFLLGASPARAELEVGGVEERDGNTPIEIEVEVAF